MSHKYLVIGLIVLLEATCSLVSVGSAKAADADALAVNAAAPAEGPPVKQQMMKLPVHVVDTDGKPVAGAKVIPWALRSSLGHGWWKDDDKRVGVGPKEVVTGNDGTANRPLSVLSRRAGSDTNLGGIALYRPSGVCLR